MSTKDTRIRAAWSCDSSYACHGWQLLGRDHAAQASVAHHYTHTAQWLGAGRRHAREPLGVRRLWQLLRWQALVEDRAHSRLQQPSQEVMPSSMGISRLPCHPAAR
jgi:hypothetical protein